MPDTGEQRTRAFELLGDVASLRGDLEGANQQYQAAMDLEPSQPVRHRLANKLHRPRLTHRDGARGNVGAVIEAAGGPVTAIGISKSSSILVRLAIAAPALVKKLVLIGTLLDFWPPNLHCHCRVLRRPAPVCQDGGY